MESIINAIVIFIAGLALLISILSLRTSTRTMKHNAFVNVQKEYRTPEMGNAVHSLWNFFRYKCNEDENILKTKFGKLIENDLKNMSKIDDESKKLEYYKSTFDNQRRLVSQFYHHLAELLNNGILTEKDVYEYWSWKGLRIIKHIIYYHSFR